MDYTIYTLLYNLIQLVRDTDSSANPTGSQRVTEKYRRNMPPAKDSGSGVTTRAQDKGNDDQAALNHVRGKSPQLILRAELMIRTHRDKENKGNFTRECPY